MKFLKRAYVRYLIKRGEIYAEELRLASEEALERRAGVLSSLRRLRVRLLQLQDY